MKYVCLLDCNNFFVSCERLFRPDLAAKPVVVLSSNDGCVVARSKEVKALGIPMGVPHFQVRNEFRKAGVEVFSSNFPLYRDISARVMRVLKDEVADIEQYSVDEAFFSFTATDNAVAESMLRDLKRTVERCVGVPVTVGAAATKTIAKCATELGKKENGVCVLTGEAWRETAQSFPLADVWGVGGKSAAKMKEYALHTAHDLMYADSGSIQRQFGVHGARLQMELNEHQAVAHDSGELQHSIMSTRSFKSATTDLRVLEDAIGYHIAHAAEELRGMDAVAGEVRVLIRPSRHGDWVLRGGTKEYRLSVPADDTRTLLKAALALTRELYEAEVPYKKAGVVLSHIIPKAQQAGSLFDTSVTDDTIFRTVDALNQRYGAQTLTIGRVGNGSAWQSSKMHVSPHYTTKWGEVPTVMA
ncbi:MAG: Y-family DNA polymerase [Candidatus Paceibacterota bacterium]